MTPREYKDLLRHRLTVDANDPIDSPKRAAKRLKDFEEPAPDEFRCAMCQGVYKKGWSDAEAMAEHDAAFGAGVVPQEDLAVLCDDCYARVDPANHPEMVEDVRKHYEERE